MQRRSWLFAGGALVVVALATWLLAQHAEVTAPLRPVAPPAPVLAGRADDPRTQPLGTLAGTVRDAAGAPIANATVCFDRTSPALSPALTSAPICEPVDARGAFRFGGMFTARYVVTAAAPTFRPGVYVPPDSSDVPAFTLAPGEHRTDLAIVLAPGAARLTGVVTDIGGGPIVHATVRGRPPLIDLDRARVPLSPVVETDADGRYELWLAPGDTRITVTAEGYAAAEAGGSAPGAIDVALTPAATISGVVLDGITQQPVVGIDVTTDGAVDRTDERGAFRLTGLVPGMFELLASGAGGYGRSEGNVTVGLAETVEGITIQVWPTTSVRGRVRTPGGPCADATVSLRDASSDKAFAATAARTGEIAIEGVLPGTYKVSVTCVDGVPRETYDDIVVGTTPLAGLTWEVDTAAVLRGNVRDHAGLPVADAVVELSNDRTTALARSHADGTYWLGGLAAGTYLASVTSEHGLAPSVPPLVLPAGGSATQDFVLATGSALQITVVDRAGTPVPGAQVSPLATTDVPAFAPLEIATSATGEATFPQLAPAEYVVTVRRDAYAQAAIGGPTRVRVEAGKPARLRFVVPAADASIRGIVVDAKGAPLADVFLAASPEGSEGEAELPRLDESRELTDAAGTFQIAHLAPGAYELRAFRRGGGETRLAHVQTGTSVRLQIAETGSIAGTVVGAASVVDLEIGIYDTTTFVDRTATFYRTRGAFKVTNLPPGTYRVEARDGARNASTTVTLGAGERRTGVRIQLGEPVRVEGRVLDARSRAPVANLVLNVNGDPQPDVRATTDGAGRFVFPRVANVAVGIIGTPADGTYATLYKAVDLSRYTKPTLDLGDVLIVKTRGADDKLGSLGATLGEALDVESVVPGGPAAIAGVAAGDRIVSVDGIDVREDPELGARLLEGLPGTRVGLGLQRGIDVTLVIGPPS